MRTTVDSSPWRFGVGAVSAERLGPVGREPFALLGVEAVAEGMADDLVGHNSRVPRVGQAAQAFVTPAASYTFCTCRMMT